MKIFLSIALVILTTNVSTLASSDNVYKVIRLRPVNDSELNFLINLIKDPNKYEMDVWKEPSTVGSAVDVMVPESSFAPLRIILQKRGITYNVTIEDVERLILKQQDAKNILLLSQRQKDDSSSNWINLAQFNSYSDIEHYLNTLQRKYPKIVEVINIGTSHEGRKLRVIKIGTESSLAKKSIWLDAGIHAREWIAPSTAVWIIHQLVLKFNKDEQISKYVNRLDWYIMPVVNPDGYEYSMSSTNPKARLWRKNRSPAICRRNRCCDGVDLNRNFDFHWGGVGSQSNPCTDMYAGEGPFSEPETKAIKEFLQKKSSSMFQAFITLHSFGQLWMYPYGYAKRSYPDDVTDLRNVALTAKSVIQDMYGTTYTVGSTSDTLYLASGTSDDWAKHTLKIKYVYTVELRPQKAAFGGFLLDESEIVPTASETFEGIKVIAEAIISGIVPKPPALYSSTKRRRKN